MADIAKALDVLRRDGPRKATWVHGLPRVREMYLDQWTRHTPDTLRATLTCDDDLPDLLASTAPHPHTRYGIVLRGAETLTDASADMLLRWVTSRALGTHALFVADAEHWPQVKGTSKPLPYEHSRLRDVFAHPRTSTLLVDGHLADTKVGHTKCAQVAAHLTTATYAEATVLAALCDHDLPRVIETCAKANAIGTYAERALRVLSAHERPQVYVDALIACQAATAASTAREVPSTAYPSVITRLDFALDVLGRIHATMKERDSTHALAARLGVNRVLVDRYRPYAKHYTPANVIRRTEALLWASEQVAKGRRAGVLELIALQW